MKGEVSDVTVEEMNKVIDKQIERCQELSFAHSDSRGASELTCSICQLINLQCDLKRLEKEINKPMTT